MAQPGPIAAFSQYFGARFAAMMLGLFPVNQNLRTARDIGSLLYKVDRKHRKRALENLRASFPEKPQAELEYIAERSMQHFIELVMDILFTTRMINVETWHQYVRLTGLADALKLFLRNRGAIVLDSFLGSGSTLIACERTGRHCRGIEIDPLYVDTAIRRWQKYTGEQAVNVATGRTFAEHEAEVAHV